MSKHPLFAAAALILAACAYVPRPPPVRYEPAGSEGIWSDGTRFHLAPTLPLAFQTAFYDPALGTSHAGEPFGTPFTFLVMADNRSDRPILLDPMAFRAFLPGEGADLQPIDPELAIRAAHQEMIDRDGAREHAQGVEAMVHLPLLLVDIATTPVKTPEEVEETGKFWKEREEAAAARNARYQEWIRTAAERRDQWSERALRKTTLFPGMRALGTVSFTADSIFLMPDSIVLGYRLQEGRALELARFARVRDSAWEAWHARAKENRKKSARHSSKVLSMPGSY